MKYKAVFFDLDGTLIDSPKFWKQAYEEVLPKYGMNFTDEHFQDIYPSGLPLTSWLTTLGIDTKHEPEIRKLRDTRYEQLLRDEIEWLPGGEEILQSLKGKTPTAIVTGSHRSYIHAIDTKLPLTKSVDFLLTDDDFNDKAHGLTLCMEKFGVGPKECIYIGDMPFDEEAALETGIDFFLIPSPYTPEDLRKRSRVIEALTTLSHHL